MPTQTLLPLEDTAADILGKAQRGLHLNNEELADRAGISIERLLEQKTGHTDPVILEKLAFVLHLHAPSLRAIADASWYPVIPSSCSGLAMFTTDYGEMTVNAYLVWDPHTGEAASFDTGATCRPMLDYLTAHSLQLVKIFITHTHLDHLKDIDALQEASQAACYGSAVENPLGLHGLRHGDGLVLGGLRIRVLGTSGHTPGGLSYFIMGLSRPIVVVGDALFAGSMGGAPYAYPEALINNREHILSLPDETLICPGHGPLTTVGEEKVHNPFFPECKPVI